MVGIIFNKKKKKYLHGLKENSSQKEKKRREGSKEDVFKQERSHQCFGKDVLKQAEGDDFQQKIAEILAWFQQSGLDPGDPKLSIMLQTTLLIEQSLRNSSNIENSLFHENNRILEEPLSQLSENTLEHQASKRKNRQPGNT